MPTNRPDRPTLRLADAPTETVEPTSQDFSMTLTGAGFRLALVGAATAALWLGLYLVVG